MNDEKLKAIEMEIMAEINKETSVENEIMNSSDEIASHLIISKTVKTEINGVAYHFKYRLIEKAGVKLMFMLVADIIKFQILSQKYRPFMVTSDMDERYSEKDNVRTAVEAFIRHITGNVKADVLEG